MDNPYTFNWEPIYRAYLPELADRFVGDYETARDLGAEKLTKQFSCVAPKYKVDSNRYDQVFWEELVIRYQNGGRTFFDELMEVSKKFGRRMPWPSGLKRWIYLEPGRFFEKFQQVPHLTYLLKMENDGERREWIAEAAKDQATTISAVQVFSYRLMFREFGAIMENHAETADALYELMDYSKRLSLEYHLIGNLVEFFSAHFPDCRPKSRDSQP